MKYFAGILIAVLSFAACKSTDLNEPVKKINKPLDKSVSNQGLQVSGSDSFTAIAQDLKKTFAKYQEEIESEQQNTTLSKEDEDARQKFLTVAKNITKMNDEEIVDIFANKDLDEFGEQKLKDADKQLVVYQAPPPAQSKKPSPTVGQVIKNDIEPYRGLI